MSDISTYIDVEDGLKRVGGNAGLYKKLLQRFIDGGYFEALENHVNAGDTEPSVHDAHTLKGVAANLSLVKVNQLSAEIEQQLKNGQDCSANMAELKDAVNKTVEAISSI